MSILSTVVTALVAGATMGAAHAAQMEAKGRAAKIPEAIIRIAIARLPEAMRDDLAEEWRAELTAVLRENRGLPITRLWRAARYALGLLRTSPAIARELASVPGEADRDRDQALGQVSLSEAFERHKQITRSRIAIALERLRLIAAELASPAGNQFIETVQAIYASEPRLVQVRDEAWVHWETDLQGGTRGGMGLVRIHRLAPPS